MDLTLVKNIFQATEDKKAQDVVILDVTAISPVTDYFIICSAVSTTQVKAIADNIEEELAKKDILLQRKEGYKEGMWILLDYGDCVVHIFTNQERQFYNLEKLWSDAKVVSLESDKPVKVGCQ